MLAEHENFAELSAQRVVLDMDSAEIPVYGQQEQSACDGHFESTCYIDVDGWSSTL